MNLFRFIRKCLTNRRAAKSSAKLVLNDIYGKIYWSFFPDRPLVYHLDTGTSLLLEPKHSFTHCFWPDVDHYEPDVKGIINFLLKRGDVFIDCGANIGYFSIYAGGIVGEKGQVIAVEANPITLETLQRNLQLNQLNPPTHCALGDYIGTTTLYSPEIGDVYSSLNQGGLIQDCNVDVKKFTVPCQT
ncbi:MAG: FkbM family methyltransferase, partial [Sphaerospermopsis sp. SIO1G2]|nr:FkbM family methyltransferase [Sphaerospermopsis sp. SIO1G2]